MLTRRTDEHIAALQAAIDSAKAMHPNAPTRITGAYLLHNANGLKISKNKFDSAWQRVMEKAVEIGITVEGSQLKLEESFNFHDLKAKGVTDHTENESGHKSEKAKQIYIRKLKLKQVDSTR